MSSTKFPARNLNQTAVYWGSPTDDGYGGFAYADPVEVSCRWVDSTRVVTDRTGKEIVCRAEVQVSQDLDEQGMLYLGTLDDLDSSEEADPMALESGRMAYEIKRFDKVPSMKGTHYFRMAYL